MDSSARIELFRSAINAQADAEITKIKRRAARKMAVAGRQKSQRAESEALAQIRREKDRLRYSFKKEMSKCDYDMKKEVLAHRHKLIEDFFDEITEELKGFRETPAYDDFLKRSMSRILSELDERRGIVYRANPADVEKLKKLTRLPVQPDETILFGGICAVSEKAGLFADYTIDKALSDAKAAFREKSELRLQY